MTRDNQLYYEKKRFLEKAISAKKLVESNKRKLAELKTLSGNPGINNYQKIESQQLNSIKGRSFDIVELIIEYENRLRDSIAKQLEREIEIKTVIEELNDTHMVLFLQYHYLEYLPMDKLESYMNLSMSSLHKLKSRAINSIKLPESVKRKKKKE